MPTTPSGYTTNYNIAKWDDGDTPGAAALNDNSDKIDTGIKAALTLAQTAANGTDLTQFICRVSGVTGNATLNVIELFNNTGATFNTTVQPINGIADWKFLFSDTPFLNKKVLFNSQTITDQLIGESDPLSIRGYATLDYYGSDYFTVNTYGTDLEPSASVLRVGTYYIFEFTIVD